MSRAQERNDRIVYCNSLRPWWLQMFKQKVSVGCRWSLRLLNVGNNLSWHWHITQSFVLGKEKMNMKTKMPEISFGYFEQTKIIHQILWATSVEMLSDAAFVLKATSNACNSTGSGQNVNKTYFICTLIGRVFSEELWRKSLLFCVHFQFKL